jgi:methylase of polypeptide subunit release factors
MARMLAQSTFTGMIRGFEINVEAYWSARTSIDTEGVSQRYTVELGDFFEAIQSGDERHVVISNPPYLPCLDNAMKLPELWGGSDGSLVSKRILDCGFDQVMLMMSSYSNPLSIIAHASHLGYRVLDWRKMSLPFGEYSREPAVFQRISDLAHDAKAFIFDTSYVLAGVRWTRDTAKPDRSKSLVRALTAPELRGRQYSVPISALRETQQILDPVSQTRSEKLLV